MSADVEVLNVDTTNPKWFKVIPAQQFDPREGPLIEIIVLFPGPVLSS